MKYEIWASGYLDQGMEGIPAKAQYVGSAEGETFAEACEKWYRENVSEEDFKKYFHIYNDSTPKYWVTLYDNEADARKQFG